MASFHSGLLKQVCLSAPQLCGSAMQQALLLAIGELQGRPRQLPAAGHMSGQTLMALPPAQFCRST